MRKINLVYVVAAFLLMLGLTACAGDGNAPENNSSNANNTENGEGGGGELTVAMGEDVVSLSTQGSNDVPSNNVTEQLYETLVELDEDQEPIPGLAEEWEEVDDTTWVFYLKEGVEFQDGEELTAEAVKQNFDRLIDEEIGSPRAHLLESVESWEVKDDYTFQMNLEYPFAPLLFNLSHIGTGIMSPATIEEDYKGMEDGEDPDSYINKHPAGTGPFKFESWTPGEEVVLSRYDGYHGELAKPERVTMKVVNELGSRIAELESNTSDIANDIGPNNVSRIKETDGIHLVQQASSVLNYIGMNVQKEPFDDQKVRQAISMAIDKESIINGVYEGTGLEAEGPIPPTIFGYDENVKGLEHDLDQAKKLMEEAGYADGLEIDLWTNDSEERVDTAVAVQSQLEKLNIDVNIEELEWGAYLERLANGEHDMFVLGWSSSGDADRALYQLFHSSQQGAAGNRTFIDHDEVDKLLEEGRKETDPEKRQEIYSELQELLIDLSPMLYLNHIEHLAGVSDDVKGFSITPQGILQLQDAYKEN